MARSPRWRPTIRRGAVVVRLARDSEGVVRLRATVTAPAEVLTMRLGFGARRGRALPRLRRALQRGRPARPHVDNYVADGPTSRPSAPLVAAFVPAWGFHPRATPPTSRSRGCSRRAGYGVLVDNDETSRFRLAPGAGVERRGRRGARLAPARLRRARARPTSLRRFTAATRPPAARRRAVRFGRGTSRPAATRPPARALRSGATRRSRSPRPTPTTCRAGPSAAGATRSAPRDRVFHARGPGRHHLLQPDGLHGLPAGASTRRRRRAR